MHGGTARMGYFSTVWEKGIKDNMHFPQTSGLVLLATKTLEQEKLHLLSQVTKKGVLRKVEGEKLKQK